MNIDRQKVLLDQIRAYAFSVNDLALYLDTHPCDTRALRYQNEYAEKLQELQEIYQKEFGPLSIYYPQDEWKWIETPWPWEKGGI